MTIKERKYIIDKEQEEWKLYERCRDVFGLDSIETEKQAIRWSTLFQLIKDLKLTKDDE